MTKYKPLMSINRVFQIPVINRIGLIALLAIFLTGCNGNQPTSTLSELNTDSEVRSMNTFGDKKYEGVDSDFIKVVRRATARYHSTTQAIRAGYEGDVHCVEVEGLGGMGYHWINGDLIDPVYDPENPEALLYEPDINGNLKLVGVEYIVINIGQERPHFGDHPFDIEGVPPLMAEGVPHWSLHVWLYKDNPEGIFKPFNPNVSCNN